MSLSLPSGRNMVILPRQRAVRRGAAGRPLEPCWPPKGPGETEFYAVDFTWVFDGQAPASVTASVTPAEAVTILTQQLIGTAYVMEIAGGTDGATAVILLTATSADGRVDLRSIILPIDGPGVAPTGASVPAPAPSAVVTTYTQSVPAAVWTIQHNLNRYPVVIVIDAAGDEVEMDVHFVDPNSLTLTAAGATSGAAYLS